MAEVSLTTDQRGVLDVLNSNAPFTTIRGYAGTGKTTTLAAWIKSNPKLAGRVLLTAPTNKAVSVIRDMCKAHEVLAQCRTIHSALGLKLKWLSGAQTLVPMQGKEGYFEDFRSFDVVVIDECSMLDDALLEYIGLAQEMAGNRVIYMGDPAQLPPIADGKDLSSSFEIEATAELTEIMRQPGNSTIPLLCEQIRNLAPSSNGLLVKEMLYEYEGKHIELHRGGVSSSPMLDEFEGSSKDIRFLAYRNATVEAAIEKIRTRLYGSGADEFVQGEMLQALKPVKDSKGRIVHATDSLLTIERISSAVHSTGIPVWLVRVEGQICTAVKSEGVSAYKKEESRLRELAKKQPHNWHKFYKFVDHFSWFRSAQGMTVHKSQGSTFDIVYVDVNDILVARDGELRRKLLYVACSRPRDRLVILI